MVMDDAKISELLKEALKEPPAPKRLVERTCWKARAAEKRFQQAEARKAKTQTPKPQKNKDIGQLHK